VSIALNKYWRFINYATLTPRYSPADSSGADIQNAYPTEGMFKWFIEIDIKST
jgi:hypothetical protein